jgi:drug/metabolite transporter (DMT)-like permease
MDDINGLLRGTDGKLSLRRILGAVAVLGGVALAFVATFQTGDWTRFIGCFASFGAGFLLVGLVTVQNIADAAKTVQGGK